jgi:hypothetical protein
MIYLDVSFRGGPTRVLAATGPDKAGLRSRKDWQRNHAAVAPSTDVYRSCTNFPAAELVISGIRIKFASLMMFLRNLKENNLVTKARERPEHFIVLWKFKTVGAFDTWKSQSRQKDEKER